jgi:hypothetical protein
MRTNTESDLGRRPWKSAGGFVAGALLAAAMVTASAAIPVAELGLAGSGTHLAPEGLCLPSLTVPAGAVAFGKLGERMGAGTADYWLLAGVGTAPLVWLSWLGATWRHASMLVVFSGAAALFGGVWFVGGFLKGRRLRSESGQTD